MQRQIETRNKLDKKHSFKPNIAAKMPQYRKKPAPAKKEEVLDRSAAALMIEEILDEFPNTEQSVKERSSAAL